MKMMRCVKTPISMMVLLMSILSCTPGVYFEIENGTTDEIVIEYLLTDDFRLVGHEGKVRISVMPGERHRLPVSPQSIRNIEGAKIRKDYFNVETFKSMFKGITIIQSSGSVLMDLVRVSQESIIYEYPSPSSVIFILRIELKR